MNAADRFFVVGLLVIFLVILVGAVVALL